MGSGFFSIGTSGLLAAQQALLVTEHNIANATTAGYSRQSVVQTTGTPVMTGSGSIGQGTQVVTVKRMYDQFIAGRINTSQTAVSELDAYYTQISQIDSLLADSDAGLSSALQSFFDGVQSVAANPSLISSRQSMVSSAQVLVNRFASLETRITELGDQVNGQITDAVNSINAFASQIGELNYRISIAQGAYNQAPNDLLDARDQLVSQMNQLIKVSTSNNSDGSINLFIGTGQQLVVGSQSVKLAATPSRADSGKMALSIVNAGGSTQEMPSSLVTGGTLGGLFSFRDGALDAAANELGRVATSLALTFNAQHGLGQNLLGDVSSSATGSFVGNFFRISAPTAQANSANTGGGSLSVSYLNPTAPGAPTYSGNFSTDLTASDYELTVLSGGRLSVVRLSDNQTIVPSGSGPYTFDGLSVDTSAATVGDRFTLQPVRYSARNLSVDPRITADPRLIAAGAPIGTAIGKYDAVTNTVKSTNTGTMKLSQGVVGTGYTVPATGSPITLTATAAVAPSTIKTLNGFPTGVTVTAVYADGTTSAVSPVAPATSSVVGLKNGSGSALAGVSFNGMYFEVTGTPEIGDQFTIGRNLTAVQDGRNAVLFGKLQTQKTSAGGTATFQDAYAKMVANNGILTSEAKLKSEAQQSLYDQAVSAREALSGVNLDEEAANLIRYQQAYQASSKALQIASTLFDTILQIS